VRKSKFFNFKYYKKLHNIAKLNLNRFYAAYDSVAVYKLNPYYQSGVFGAKPDFSEKVK